MALSEERLIFIFNQSFEPEYAAFWVIMREYIICYCGKVTGVIYDNRVIVKPANFVVALIPNEDMDFPCEIGKENFACD